MNNKHYFDFENQFRGDRKKIITKLSMYDCLVKKVIASNDSNKFIDIGCGRGEWLEKWSTKDLECIGIEKNQRMIEFCQNLALNVLNANAIDILKKLPDKSVSIFTLFHVIEHLKDKELFILIDEISRILTDNGVLIMETPSIDNLSISTKLFYLDPTHINHINPDGLSFSLQKSKFDKVKYFYINGGPLQDSAPFKLTRVLNGVAQDVVFIVTKSKKMSDELFHRDIDWSLCFPTAPTTLDAAVEFDLQYDQLEIRKSEQFNSENTFLKNEMLSLKNEKNLLKEEVDLLKSELKYIIFLIKVFRRLLFPVVYFFRFFKKKSMYLINHIFIYLINFKIIRKIIFSELTFQFINNIPNNLFGKKIKRAIIFVQDTVNKLSAIDSHSYRFNSKLNKYYNKSDKAKAYSSEIKNRLRSRER